MTTLQLMKVCSGNIKLYLNANIAWLVFCIDNSQLLDSPTDCDSGSTNKSTTTCTTSSTTASGSGDCSRSFPTRGR